MFNSVIDTRFNSFLFFFHQEIAQTLLNEDHASEEEVIIVAETKQKTPSSKSIKPRQEVGKTIILYVAVPLQYQRTVQINTVKFEKGAGGKDFFIVQTNQNTGYLVRVSITSHKVFQSTYLTC